MSPLMAVPQIGRPAAYFCRAAQTKPVISIGEVLTQIRRPPGTLLTRNISKILPQAVGMVIDGSTSGSASRYARPESSFGRR